MARRADPTPGHQRFLGLAAVAGLSVATALAFGRVFTGRQATLELVAAALGVGGDRGPVRTPRVAARDAREPRRPRARDHVDRPAADGVVRPAVDPDAPRDRTFARVRRPAGARSGRAHAPAAAPDARGGDGGVDRRVLVARARDPRGSPLLAILPPIALVGFADTVLEDGARPIYAITPAGGRARRRVRGRPAPGPPVGSRVVGFEDPASRQLGAGLETGRVRGDRRRGARPGSAPGVPLGTARSTSRPRATRAQA